MNVQYVGIIHSIGKYNGHLTGDREERIGGGDKGGGESRIAHKLYTCIVNCIDPTRRSCATRSEQISPVGFNITWSCPLNTSVTRLRSIKDSHAYAHAPHNCKIYRFQTNLLKVIANFHYEYVSIFIIK